MQELNCYFVCERLVLTVKVKMLCTKGTILKGTFEKKGHSINICQDTGVLLEISSFLTMYFIVKSEMFVICCTASTVQLRNKRTSHTRTIRK